MIKSIQLALFVLFTSSIFAQIKQPDLSPNTIENQIKTIYNQANDWQDYKMIKKATFFSFQKKLLDSISVMKKEIVLKQNTINQQDKIIQTLNDKIKTLDDKLSSSLEEVDSMSLLGNQINKTAYNSLLWSIIIGLILCLAFFVYKFKNSNLITKKAKNSLVEIDQEFELFRKRALEKEQKLRRQLQDEINKQRGV